MILRRADTVLGANALAEAKQLVGNERSLLAIERLEKLYEVLKKYGTEKYVAFDLGLLSKYNYYTGVIFKGYTYGVGDAVVTGGRYDRLLSYFGKQAPAIGFVFVVDDLMEALSRQKRLPKLSEEGVKLYYERDTFDEMLQEAQKLRRARTKVTLLPKEEL